jgi:hypothetical protein
MSKLGLVLVMVLMLGRTNAQTYPAPDNEPLTYFVLIQADDGQAFYIRLDDQLYSSSPDGHLILSRLKDSVYTITVGFPGQTHPEQRYLLNIHQKDWALRLTRQDNRWGLFDSHGEAIASVADRSTTEKPMLAGTKKDDAFSQLMSAIVQDTAVMYNTYTATPSDSAQPVALASAATSAPADQIVHATSATATPSPTISAPVISAPIAPAPAATRIIHDTSASAVPSIIRDSSNPSHSPIDTVSLQPVSPLSSNTDAAIPSAPTGVVKLSEHRSTQSLSLVYTDHPVDRKTDTIDVVIPVDSQTAAAPHRQSPDTSHSIATHPLRSSDSSHSTTTHSVRSSDSSLFTATRHAQPPDISRSSHALKSDSPNLTTSHRSNLPFINSDCHAFATDYDVDKLRVRMLNASKDDDRIEAAYKVFKTKCFTTKQIRALSEVFPTDAARFKFLATAYPFVSDDDFPELVNLLSDPVYTGRFRTMTDRH